MTVADHQSFIETTECHRYAAKLSTDSVQRHCQKSCSVMALALRPKEWSSILVAPYSPSFQWRTEHKCRPGRRPQMPPFQEKFCCPAQTNVNQTFLLVIHPKMKILLDELCRPLCRPPFPVPPLICPILQKIVPFH